MKKILIIEDDPAILKGLQISLEEEHYKIYTEINGVKGFETAQKQLFDLIILDLMLPGMNGQEICKKLRNQSISTPIIMLTSKKEEADKVLGLELGADDYVTKPFSIRELIARIKALLRRTQKENVSIEQFTFGKIHIDFQKQVLIKDDRPIKLSVREFEILRYFIEHEDQVVTRDMLLNDIWGYDIFPTTRTVDTFILNLRKKIEADPSNPKHLITIHKAGYKFLR